MPIGLYVHLPFCRSKCAYCDFCSYPGLMDLLPAYIDGLMAEYDAYEPSLRGEELASVYLGGGTPSLLPVELLTRVLSLSSRLPRKSGLEVTMEANPGTGDREKLSAFVESGGTRLSVGVQTHDDGLLRLLGRGHTARDAAALVECARSVGVRQINLDLIYGLPGQTVANWTETLAFALSLSPEHLSLYSLELHDDTPLARAVAEGELRLPAEEESLAMLQTAMSMLPAAGLRQYEIASFAADGAECIHNINYWRNGHYLGLGAAAHSHLGARRWANLTDPRAYLAALARGGLPVASEEHLALADELMETVMLGLRLRQGLDLSLLQADYGLAPSALFGEKLGELSGLGLVTVEGGWLRLTDSGVFLADFVLRKLARALP